MQMGPQFSNLEMHVKTAESIPGFIDLQINGYLGVDFSSPTLTVADVVRATAALHAAGTAGYLAAVCTSDVATYDHVLPRLAEAMHAPSCRGILLGIHLEGPFISPGHEVVGVHPEALVRDPSMEFFEYLQTAACGNVRLLTLAPEQPGAMAVIRGARKLGAAVGIGHTLADDACIQEAVAAGATLSVHLGNGCPNMIHRHRNSIWPQLAATELTAAIITDGHHLPASLIRTVCAAKGAARTLVVSDSSPPAGCPPGDYELLGSRVRLESNGLLRNLEKDTLAGSSANMLECMNTLAGLNIFSRDELLQVGRDNPLRIIGIDIPAEHVAHNHNVVFDGGRFRACATGANRTPAVAD